MYRVSLAAARVNANLTQKAAARELNVSNRTLWQWENGISYPTADKVAAMCALYCVPYDNLNFFCKE